MTTVASIASTIRAAKASEASAPATHHPRGITGTDSLHPHNPHVLVPVCSHFTDEETEGTEGLRNLPKDSQPANDRAGTGPQ